VSVVLPHDVGARAPSAMRAQRSLVPTLLRRVALGLLTLLLVSVVIFAATQVLPGDAAQAVLGRDATPARLASLRLQLHLNRPATTQYALWLRGILTGNPGTSLATGRGVWWDVEPRLLNSLFLLAVVALVAIPLSLLLGTLAALRRGRALDRGASLVTLAAAALPEFVVAIVLVLVFATSVVHWLPPVSLVPPGSHAWSHPRDLVLPVATLVVVVVPYVFRMMRAAALEVLDSEYVEMARLKGLSRRRLLLAHVLPNAIPPTIQSIALTLAYLAGGVVVVEYVFGYPGIGQGLVNSVDARDIPEVQFIVIALAAFYVGVNIAADAVVMLVTPRLRTA
jgi:peptide/nickel transport system permease protein